LKSAPAAFVAAGAPLSAARARCTMPIETTAFSLRPTDMPVRENQVKQILRSGGTIYSSAVRLSEPSLCELLGYAGFDFVLIDGEHGAVDAATIDRLVQGCFAGGTVPVVRVLRNDEPEAVMKALDLGAQG